MNSMTGYVYVLINPSMNGILKIGKTQNSPEERAKELSSVTGVPTQFFVAYQAYFKDCNAAEIFVHTRLENNRLADNREFFRASVQQAIEAVREAENILGITSEPIIGVVLGSGETSSETVELWRVVFDSANAHFYGIGDTIQDQSEAVQIYIKAAKLGSISAYWKIGNMYLSGHGCNQDIQKAKNAYLEGTKAGNDLCWAGLAEIYWREKHVDNWDKCWKRYFSSAFFIERKQFNEYIVGEKIMSQGAHQMYSYVSHVEFRKWNMSQRQLILESRAEILGFIALDRKYTGDNEIIQRVEANIINLMQQAQEEIPQKIIIGTSSEYFADIYQKPMNIVSQALQKANSPFLPPLSDDELKRKSPLEIFQMANTFYYQDSNDDHSKNGIYLYERAALAGFKLAYWKIGRIYSSGYDVVADAEKAMKFLSTGAELGVDLCWTELAYIFAQNKNLEKWNYCWKRYFESKTFLNNIVFNELIDFDKFKNSRAYQMFFYIQQASENKWETIFIPLVIKFRKEIFEKILQNVDSVRTGGEKPINELIELINMMDPGNTKGAIDYCQEILAEIPVE